MYVEDLLFGIAFRDDVAPPEVDPLRESDALREAQVLDARVEAISSRIAILFEFRNALNFEAGNTAVLVARGVREFHWSADARSTDRTAWNVGWSELRTLDHLFAFDLTFAPAGKMQIVAERIEFYVGNVVGIQQIPDYGQDDDATIRASLPNWNSSFSAIGASFRGETGLSRHQGPGEDSVG